MKTSILLSRREFITTVSALALTAMQLPKVVDGSNARHDEFVIVNGWVLKRDETA